MAEPDIRSQPARPGFLRGNVLVFMITMVLGQFGRNMAFPYASLYVLALGGKPEHVGLVNSITPLAGLIVFPIAGYFADIRGRVRLIALAMAYSGFLNILQALAPTWQILAWNALFQGFLVVQFPASSALMADSLAPKDRVRGIATMNGIAGGIGLIAPYLAGAIVTRLGAEMGMRLLYGALALFNLVSAAISWRFLQETTSPQQSRLDWKRLGQLVKSAYVEIPSLLKNLSPSLRALGGISALSFVANALAGPFWVVYAIERVGLTAEQWGLILLIETALLNLAYIPAAAWIDRLGRARTLHLSLILTTTLTPLFVLARGFWPILLIRMAFALGNAFFMPACLALMADSTPREMRGRVMGAIGNGTVMLGATMGGTGGPGLGFLIIPPLMAASLASGLLYVQNAALPWFAATVALMLAIFLALRFVRDPHHPEI